jgi:hypothetical protein
MSDLVLKKEIRCFIRSSGLQANFKMVCPIVRLLNMKYKNIDNKKARFLANSIIDKII